MSISIILLILTLHFVSDFLLQTHYQSINKSSSNKVLALHVLTYSIPFLIFFGVVYATVNYVLHFATDYVSSRITKKLFVKGAETNNYHWAFAVIGLDQLVHYACLFLTYIWLVQ